PLEALEACAARGDRQGTVSQVDQLKPPSSPRRGEFPDPKLVGHNKEIFMNTHDTNSLVPFRVALIGAALLVLPLRMAQAADPAIENLREEIKQLQSQVANLTNQVTTLKSELGSLQAPPANLLAIAPYVSIETANGLTAVRFTGVNLQVVNGK